MLQKSGIDCKLGCFSFCQEFDFKVHHVLKRSHLEKNQLDWPVGEMRGPFMNLKHKGTLPKTNIAPEK